jgi:hypothetical protein
MRIFDVTRNWPWQTTRYLRNTTRILDCFKSNCWAKEVLTFYLLLLFVYSKCTRSFDQNSWGLYFLIYFSVVESILRGETVGITSRRSRASSQVTFFVFIYYCELFTPAVLYLFRFANTKNSCYF